MKLAIMQPYFFPYIGYYQLIHEVDEFVIYDNIEFTKKGWINRNRILVNGKDSYITIPLKNDSDFLNVRDRFLAENWSVEKKKMLNRITEAYKKSKNFEIVYSVIKSILNYEESNLFGFILNSLKLINEYLGINTPIVVSSTIPIDHTLKADKKVIEICKSRKASIYINPIGGIELYSKDYFKEKGIELQFLKSGEISYKQFENEFVPWLSIIDVMMFNTQAEIKKLLQFKALL